MVDCSIEGTANVANGGFGFARDDWSAEVINKPFRRVVRARSHRELTVRLDERQRERERVARELHDSLLQGFLGVSLQLQAAVGQVPANHQSKAALNHTMVRMQHVIDETRHVLLGLRSSATESMSLDQALSSLRDEFAPGGSVQFRVCVTGQPKSLRPAIQEQIYLIGREALINAFRHSEATSIEAEVEYRPQGLRILVRDNGRGIDPETARSGRHSHWGLVGMRERAAGIGAQLRIWSRLGAGTEVEIWVQAADWEKPCLTKRLKWQGGTVRASRRQSNVAGRVPNSAYASGNQI
jgi:signal transduction histidine kinase